MKNKDIVNITEVTSRIQLNKIEEKPTRKAVLKLHMDLYAESQRDIVYKRRNVAR